MIREKVLLVVESSAAGVGRHVLDLAAGLLKRQCEVHVAYSTLRMDAIFAGRIRDLLREWPHAFALPLFLKRNLCLSDIGTALQLRRYIRERGPFDVIHSHSTKAGVIGRLSALGLGGRRIYTPHAPLTMSPAMGSGARRMIAIGERLLSLATDAIIAVSEEEQTHLEELGIPARRLHLVWNGIAPVGGKSSTGRQAARALMGMEGDEICVGFVGRLVAQKNVDLLLRAFARARQNLFGRSRLVIVGDGPLNLPLRRSASSLGIAGCVTWLGEVSGQMVMPGFDVFALPSCYEGCPYVLLEALSSGLPIVSTMVGGAISAVKHGQNGYLVPVGDEAGFSSALVALLLSRSVRTSMARESLRISSSHSLETMVERTTGVYRLRMNAGNPDRQAVGLAVGVQQ